MSNHDDLSFFVQSTTNKIIELIENEIEKSEIEILKKDYNKDLIKGKIVNLFTARNGHFFYRAFNNSFNSGDLK